MKICLVGNQNCGKTTLFNLLTGSNQKIGNWPGVTIEKKTGIIKGTDYELIDLPGIYSLMPYTSEEKVTSEYILQEDPDLIVNIIDATHLERSLYLTLQLLEIGCNVIIALNMVDILSKKGIRINSQNMQKELNTTVCEISALKQTGIDELIAEIERNASINASIKANIDVDINANINAKNYAQSDTEKIRKEIISHNNKISNYRKFIQCKDIAEYEKVATERYNYISSIKPKFWTRKVTYINNTDVLDKIFLNKYISIPIFVIIMFAIYFVSVGVVGKYTTGVVNNCIEKFAINIQTFLIHINVSDWLQSLVLDGIIKGVGSVLSFVPQLTILFLCISILETTGYMSRIAFLLDNIFRKVGLSGKSLIPFIVGSGCSVPGIMSTKIIENEDEKKMTSVLVPFIPCSAKLPIIALFSGYFFKDNAGIVSASLYFLAILVIIFSSIIMKKFVFVNTTSSFISELPDYKLPSIKYVAKEVWDKVISFIKRAGSTIFIASIVIWFLLSFSISFSGGLSLKYGIPIEESILATIGKKISFIFYPILGVNSWEATVSAIQGLIAKEQVISSMSIISGMSEQNALFGSNSIYGFFTPASAYAFVVFNLFSAPCFAAIGAMKKELGGVKNMLKAVMFQCTLAWVLAFMVSKILQVVLF